MSPPQNWRRSDDGKAWIADYSGEREWLDFWLVNHSKAKGIYDLAEDLFENIDSMGVISLICDIEKHFTIRFNERDFQNRKFATVSGLAEIIRDKQA